MEEYSAGMSAVFALLAALQISASARLLIRQAPALRHAHGPAGGNWARGKAQWILLLVPASVARATALLLLLADMVAKADGGVPAQIAFLFQAASLFDAAASWLFYSVKVGVIAAWAASRRGPGPHWGAFLVGAATLSLVMALSLAVTVTLSLHYGAACMQTHAVLPCEQRQAWFATFHLALVLISLLTTLIALGVALSTARLRERTRGGDADNGPASGVFGGRAFVPLSQEAAALEHAAHLCTVSFCWWTLFNVYAALRAALLVQSTPTEVAVAVAANCLLSELIPSGAISLALSRHVARLSRHSRHAPARPGAYAY
ncbi:hypothetical protein T484DRAFT_2025371, partial [Baffinella frigidus]